MDNTEEIANLPILSATGNHQQSANHQAPPVMGNHQLVIITQLLQIAGSMRHIDELFLWLSHMLVQRLDVSVIQFWAIQNAGTHIPATELRTMASQNVSLPQSIVINAQVVEVTEHILNERHSTLPQPVASIFSQHQANLLIRHNLNYWGCCFLSSTALLPPTNKDISTSKTATPLTMLVSVFLQQAPSQRLMPTVSHILEQAIPIARNRGLLMLDRPKDLDHLTISPKKNSVALADLIPHHFQNMDALQSSNPFASTAMIQNKQIRHLYLAMDGRKSIGKLLISTHMDTKDFYVALRTLLVQKYIQLYEPNGRLIDSSQLLKKF